MIDTEPLWTIDEVASYLRVSVWTLYHWRNRGYGPPGGRVGKHIRYRVADVVAWFEEQQRQDAA